MTEQITAEAAEEYVKRRWYRAYLYLSLSGTPFVQFGPHALETWLGAYAFTREHEEKIRQIRVALKWANDARVIVHIDEYDMDAKRIVLTILESQLVDLLRGFKEQP